MKSQNNGRTFSKEEPQIYHWSIKGWAHDEGQNLQIQGNHTHTHPKSFKMREQTKNYIKKNKNLTSNFYQKYHIIDNNKSNKTLSYMFWEMMTWT